jgi:phospholipid/cholesterol/gamma-HCH transport system substrate-binding protein
MLSQRTIESFVGLFLLAAILSLLVLAFKVSGITSVFKEEGYRISAEFDDIGQLKVRAAVKIGGVKVGEVSAISLNPETFKAMVTMRINPKVNDIPVDSSASILTAGILGDNYIELSPMYSNEFLQNGGQIQETHSAMILERLIGQFMYKMGQSDSNDSKTTENGTNNTKDAQQGAHS